MSDEDFNFLVCSLTQISQRLSSIEANQRNAESGTTDCSSRQDAELSNENRAFQPAGNPDELEELSCQIQCRLNKLWEIKPKIGKRSSGKIAAFETVQDLICELKERRGC